MSLCTADIEETLSTIRVMRRQEETVYATCDYLNNIHEMMITGRDEPVDAACRLAMAQWCFQIVEFCNYKRETAAVCMNNLDRFLATEAGETILSDRSQFQLAAMTALYTAVKIHEHEAMDPNLVSRLSEGIHSPEAVETMESVMLNAIQWRVNPPTSMAFVRMFLDLVPGYVLDEATRTTIMELAQYQTELAVCECQFCGTNPSFVAFASLLNAIDSLDDAKLSRNFEIVVSRAAHIDSTRLLDLRVELYEAIAEETSDQPISATLASKPSSCGSASIENSQSSIHTSPRSVSA